MRLVGWSLTAAAAVVFSLGTPTVRAQAFTIEQALSAPFASDLVAAPAKGRLLWFANAEGRHNLWVAEPAPGGKGYVSRQLTHYAEDDGQELNTPQWTPDASTIVYVRGDNVQGETHPVPNPAWFPRGAQQQIWAVSAEGGEPRLLAEGRDPAVSPDGRRVAYTLRGQVWMVALDDARARPEQVLQTRGTAGDLRWSPDGSRLALVSNRGDHSFIAVYTPAASGPSGAAGAASGGAAGGAAVAVTYLDPSTDRDGDPAWSPDSRSIAFIRTPSQRDTLSFEPHRAGYPWSLRVAEVGGGTGHEIWRAEEGPGSVYQRTDSPEQLHWTAGNRIVFAWERSGWLHLYAVAAAGGRAAELTPGEFEVENVSLSEDRRTLVFDSNQNDIDRRHVWRVVFAADGSNHAIEAVTAGEGIETQPVVASDGKTVAVLRSDVRLPVRPAMVEGSQLTDLAPQAMPAGFPSERFVTPRQVIFPAADGMLIHGQLFLPAGLRPGERRPAMVFFHGGSKRQMLLGWHYMEYYSNAYGMNQYLASLGYIVLSVNYRSGIGYGLNFREALNYGATGASEFNDVMGAGLYLKARQDVDGARIGSWGGSYGGYLTALALARASSLFSAGVDMHGVHDWNTELPTFSPSYDPNARPEVARVAYASSPIASVSTWRSPVLLIHGDDDRNVPFAQDIELVPELRKYKVDFEELIFPDEIHEFLLHRDWLHAYSASAEFLGRKLAPAPAAVH
jgi:dipeptidyl aminopeptidase/acylaminoacyl peptidase